MKRLVSICTLAVLLLAGCASKPSEPKADTTIKVGASPTPHAIILEALRPEIESKGYKLEIVEFNDYVLPNTALEANELDANYFAHLPYQEDFNVKNGTHIKSVLAVHFEPFGIYPGKSASLDDLNGKTFAIPNDTTNEARALQLLAKNGYITLDPSKGLEATPKDITENPHNLQFVELEAATIPRTLADVDFGIINGNYALSANLGDSVLLTETSDSEGAAKYANILCVKEGNETSEKTKVLLEAFKSAAVKQVVAEKFGKLVVLVIE